MTETVTTTLPRQNPVSSPRFVGIIAIAYATSLIIQNGLFGGDAPTYSTPIEAVFTYHAENQSALAITSGLEVINMVLLLLFVSMMHGLIQRRGTAGTDWSRLALAAGAVLSSFSALLIATHIAVIVAANTLTEPNAAFEIMWQLHAAAFALMLPALGTTFIGVALATHASQLTRPWVLVLGALGGSLAILAGVGNLAIAAGSPLLFVGVAGLGMWIVWLIATGVQLIRIKN